MLYDLLAFLAGMICFRYRTLEEMQLGKEHEFLREQAILESEHRKQETEHKLKMLSIMMGNASQINQHAVHDPNLHATNAVYQCKPLAPYPTA